MLQLIDYNFAFVACEKGISRRVSLEEQLFPVISVQYKQS